MQWEGPTGPSSYVMATDSGETDAKSGEEKQEEMMSMTRRSMAHTHSTVDTVQNIDVVQSDTTAGTPGGFSAFLESATQPILAVTYWFDPAPHAGFSPITVRFSGRRVEAKGRVHAGDRFVQDETIEKVVPGSGPISLTARVHGINAGSWAVTARMLESAHHARGPSEYGNEAFAAPLSWFALSCHR